jgi:hypothetical protein
LHKKIEQIYSNFGQQVTFQNSSYTMCTMGEISIHLCLRTSRGQKIRRIFHENKLKMRHLSIVFKRTYVTMVLEDIVRAKYRRLGRLVSPPKKEKIRPNNAVGLCKFDAGPVFNILGSRLSQ